ncbi:MAG TPA: FAD-linked oxidase C-terminal domain-containing protein [Anaerolineaceae bacterium]|nr:FAD-linked oxidase C-terminal domain-containing protein [Anaerolineaceae bacterium]HPN51881.1 FAD-linked oxidase C-terminal domain-containing protein [Anaerolineaceae bacterium]
MPAYQPLTPDIAAELRLIVGDKNVIYADPEKLEDFAHDEVADKKLAHMPEAVVRPASAEEISAIMKLANRERIPVTPRGAGSGLSGGAVPAEGGIVLLVDRMNRILEIDRANLVVVVEPGVVTNDINAAIKEDGLFYAGYPMSVESCFVGGNVAENAGGGKAIKYGVTGRYVMGLEVVLPTGEIVQMGGKRVKDVVGYDLLHLMVGSEGTLGIFTKIILKLQPLPTARADLLVLFRDVPSAMKMVPLIMTNGRIIPTAIEFMDRLSVQTTCKYLNEDLPYQEAGAMLLIEVDGSSEEQVDREFETIGELCQANGAIEVYVATNATTQERVWAVRRNIAEAFKVFSPVQSLEDIVVPFAQIPDLIPVLDRLSAKYNLLMPCYGHAGDGNLHVTLVKKPETPLEQWEDLEHAVLVELYKAVANLGGTISGEHGIGSKRREFMPLVMDETLIRLQKQIKSAFDPNNILNPGKIFP